jgi:hypothetical protein
MQAPAVPTKANIQPGTIAAPRKVIDIDSLIFTEGGHLMSRKKVKLPEGSFKRQMKGYEEIHVPEPKRREAGADEWMSVRKMPDWTQPVWASVKAESLNPIQTRVFPIAFETNEPMLICAPTGAGKVCDHFPSHPVSKRGRRLMSRQIVPLSLSSALLASSATPTPATLTATRSKSSTCRP